MKLLVSTLSGVLCGLLLQTPATPDQAVSSAQTQLHEAEVRHLAPLYGIDMTRGNWTSQAVSVCPVFSHHSFARFEPGGAAGVAAPFLAAYPLGVMTASPAGKPWRSGIVLIRLAGAPASQPRTPADLANTVLVYNRLWTEELARIGLPEAQRTITWDSLASCFANLAGEQRPAPQADFRQDAPPATLGAARVGGILLPVTGASPKTRSLSISFDPKGLILESSVSVT